jgi:hypothetical protein
VHHSLLVQQVQTEVQATDLALAQEVALDTGIIMRGATAALAELSRLPAVQDGHVGAMAGIFRAFKAARQDIDHESVS